MKTLLISLTKLLGVASLIFSTANIFAGDISFYGVIKQQDWIQTNSGPSVLDSGTPFRFECVVDSSQSNVLNSASVQLPIGGTRTLVSNGPDSLHFKENFSSTTALNAAYGTGTYSLTVDSVNDFTSFAQLTMPSDVYPNAPEIINYSAAQSINPTNSFTLTWNAFTGGTANDFIQVAVYSPTIGADVLHTDGPGQSGSLNGTNTSIVIPANTLMAGQSYQVELFFGKITTFNSTSIPGANGVVGFAKRTKLTIQTTTPPGAISFYGVLKQQNFMQTNNGAPVLSTNGSPFGFQTFLNATTTNFINSATVLPPNSSLRNLSSGDSGQFWFFNQGFNTLGDLNNSYGSGNYAVSINVQTSSNSSSYNVSMPLVGDTYPNAPQFTNFLAAQSINPSNSFTFYWNAFSGGTTNDYVQLQINNSNGDNEIFQTGQPGQTNALNGTSPNFIQIPANILSPGTSYSIKLLFAHTITTDTTSIPSALGFASYVKETSANIRTTGTPFTIQLQVIGFVGGQFKFKFNSRPGRGYQIQWADNLPSWGNLGYTNATSSETVFTDTFSVAPKRFYRVQEQ